MSEQMEYNKPKVSALSEFSALSVGIIVAMFFFALASLAGYIYMTQPPKKTVDIEDKADLLSQEEESDLLRKAKKIRSEKKINVIIVTTAEKGSNYAYGDDGSAAFAIDKYKKLAKTIWLKDNSGIIFLIDMENRYLYIYTYATAHGVIPDTECKSMAESVADRFTNEEYAEGLDSLLDQVDNRTFFSCTLLFVFLFNIIGPLVITAIVLFIVLHRKRNKITVNQSTYLDPAASRENEDQDLFLRKTTTVTYASGGSGVSGGGFRGGGGGGFSGGGGGRGGGGGAHF